MPRGSRPVEVEAVCPNAGPVKQFAGMLLIAGFGIYGPIEVKVRGETENMKREWMTKSAKELETIVATKFFFL